MKQIKENTEEQRHISWTPLLIDNAAQLWFSKREGRNKICKKDKVEIERKANIGRDCIRQYSMTDASQPAVFLDDNQKANK